MKMIVGSVLVAGTVLLTGCSGSINFDHDRSIDRFLLADRVSDTLRHKTSAWPTSTRCDGSLSGEKGATQRCWITDRDGVLWGVTTTVTSLDDRGIYFDVDVDAKPANKTE
ncbi:DUF4333 domain-containing protein [Mycobacteroides chelonae]|uniref:DUF4333 domain-containing protein n=1 Tax=Mycobacteroides chelonae TaxID=1774 RepID=UPI00222F6141|nr:DUF4333 domain-containing protein [Mycobacteroides chelonae]